VSRSLTRASAFVLAAITALALALPAFAQGADGQAQVRVAHLSSDAPNVDVYVNGEPVAALTNVPYGTVSGYLPLPAGTQQVTVYATGDTSAPVIDTPVELAAGGTYTVAAVGLVSDASLTAQVYEDDASAPAAGNAKVRIVHASPDAGPVDVATADGTYLASGLGYPSASPYAQVPAGTYDVNVLAAGTDTVAISAPGTSVADGGVYTAFATGTASAGSLGVILVQDNAGVETLASTGGISLAWVAAALATAVVVLSSGAAAGAYALRRARAAQD
jgi:hypothetical protein